MSSKHRSGHKTIARFTVEELAHAQNKLTKNLQMDAQAGCHLFQGVTNDSGYGVLSVHGITFAAHRLAYEIAYGAIDFEAQNWWVLHHCDTPSCCNPGHLYLGGPAENAADMAQRCRMRKGCRPKTARGLSQEYENTPVGTVYYEYKGKIKPLKQWSIEFGLDLSTLDRRFLCGWPEENLCRAPERGFRNWRSRHDDFPKRNYYRRFSGAEEVHKYLSQQSEKENALAVRATKAPSVNNPSS